MTENEQYYTKLKKINTIKKVGIDGNGNHYKFDRRSKCYKRLDKDGKMTKVPASSRVKIDEKVILPEKSFMGFDLETKDGLKGKELFCWRLAYRINFGKIKILRGNESLKLFFDFFAKKFEKKQARKYSQNRKQMTNIYVHNLSFDIRFIIDYCIKHDIMFQPIISGSAFIACVINDFGMRFIDSLQFLKTSQEKAEIEWEIESEITKAQTDALMTELFRNKKYKDGLKPFGKWTEIEKETLKLHCDNDSVALLLIMIKVRETFGLIAGVDMLRFISLASLAMECLRTTLDDLEILNPFLLFSKNAEGKICYQVDKVKEEFVRQSYLGGRNELFILGLFDDLDYVDRVSMYSSEMKLQKYPAGVPVWLGKFKNEKDELMKIIDGKDKRLGFIKARVSKGRSKTKYPVIGKRLQQRIMFTNCTTVGIYTSVELVYAKKIGYKIEPMEGLIYPETEKYFVNFVDKFYPIKANNKGGKKHAAKITLNAPYGKFGQQFERTALDIKYFVDLEDMNEFIMDSEHPEKLICRYNHEYRLYLVMDPYQSSSLKRYMNVGIASFVTAYSRLALVKMFHLCEKRGIDVYYADTDSFTIKNSDYERLKNMKSIKAQKIFHSRLGGWEVENHFQQVEFVAPKCYCSIITDKKSGKDEIHLKMKGIAKSKIKEICEKVEKEYKKNPLLNRMGRIKKLIAEPIAMAERYMTFKEAMRSGVVLGTRQTTKHYSLINFKRKFYRKTGLSEPWNDKTIPLQFKKDLEEPIDTKSDDLDEWED